MSSADGCQTKRSIESSAEPNSPETKHWPYVGWVPTVNGRLSFRHLGDTRHPEESIFANLDLDSGRLVIAYQKRPLSDILLPKIIQRALNLSGDFWFVLTGRTNGTPLAADRIDGTIWIFKTKEDWRRNANKVVRASIRDVNELRYSQNSQIDALATLAFDMACSTLAIEADIKVEFQLERDGQGRFNYPQFREQAIETASTDFAKRDGHNLRKWVADQSYFFLRDIGHAHQHHHPYSDTILILQDADIEDVQWRKNIVYSLHYAIIRFKRDADVRSTWRAVGILAYCRSFEECCKRRIPELDLPAFNEKPLLMSLNAKANEITIAEQEVSNQQNTRFAKAGTLRAIATAIIAVIIAVLAILIQPRISKDEQGTFPNLYAASTFAADNSFSLLGLGGVFLMFIWILTHNGWVTHSRAGRSILEAAYIRRWPSIIGLFIAAALGAIVTLWSFRSAVMDAYNSIKDFVSLLAN